jgi:putative ABC transport system permease protein
MGDLFRSALRELCRRRWRTAVTVGGYVLAVASVVVLVTALLGARGAADRVLTSTGTHFIVFAPASHEACPQCTLANMADPSEGFEANGIATGLVPASFAQHVRELPTVRDASPYLRFRFKDPKSGAMFTVGGFDPDNRTAVGTTCCAATDIVEGRFLAPRDAGAAMAEEGYARLRGLKVGDRVTVAEEAFEIVGIVNPGIRPAKADLYMHRADARRVINERLVSRRVGDEVNVLLVEVRSSTVQDEAIASVKRLMQGLLVSSYACYKPASQVIGMNARAAGILSGLMAACALVVAMKSQLASVVERRRDIAILKAIGWTDGRIVLQVLVESLLVAAAGGAAGCALGALVIATASLGAWSGLPGGEGLAVSGRVLVAGLVLATAGGLVAGAVPALAAARQRPAEALRRV